MQIALNKHYGEFIDRGYTIIRSLFNKKLIEDWDNIVEHYTKDIKSKKLYGHFFSSDIDLAYRTVANDVTLTFLEKIWGPFVQFDGLTLVVSPPYDVNRPLTLEEGISWHRDPYSNIPIGNCFEKPLGINLLTYLQNLDDVSGPLRVIPYSHREHFTIPNKERKMPHKLEQLLYLEKGDAVILHTNLVHSRSPNKSNQWRCYLSVFYNLSLLKSSYAFNTPEIEGIITAAERNNDRRIMRLFGYDSQFEARTNCGGMEEETIFWNEWLEEDRIFKEGKANKPF